MGANIMDEIELVGDGAGTITGIDDDHNEQPEGYPAWLYQNQPNPFKSYTKIRYYLDEGCHVSLIVYDINGQEIKRLVNEFKT
jgi:hypothetical protein